MGTPTLILTGYLVEACEPWAVLPTQRTKEDSLCAPRGSPADLSHSCGLKRLYGFDPTPCRQISKTVLTAQQPVQWPDGIPPRELTWATSIHSPAKRLAIWGPTCGPLSQHQPYISRYWRQFHLSRDRQGTCPPKPLITGLTTVNPTWAEQQPCDQAPTPLEWSPRDNPISPGTL